jgi:hypothetical protein
LKDANGNVVSEAYVIAWAANYTDVHSETQPVQVSTTPRYKYHFRHPKGETTSAGSACAAKPLDAGIEAEDPLLIGIGMHAFQDSWAHHGADSQHAFNKMYDRPAEYPEWAKEMAEAVFNKLKYYYYLRTGKTSPLHWEDVEGDVLRMLLVSRKDTKGKRDYDLETKSGVRIWKGRIKLEFGEDCDFGKVKEDDGHPWAKEFLDAANQVDNPVDE